MHQTKIIFSYRDIKQHKCHALIMPFRNLKFETYPGKIINDFSVDYRQKIEEKSAAMESIGNLALWKCVGVPNFQAVAFVNIGPTQDNIKTWMVSTFESISKAYSQIKTIVLPYSSDLGPAE